MISVDESRAVVSDLAARLRRHYGPRLEQIVLFGSRAREEAADDSDFDVLVVLDGPVDPRRERRETRDLVYSLCREHDVVLSCHYVPSARYSGERSPFMLNVHREGVSVLREDGDYDYAAAIGMDECREQIERAEVLLDTARTRLGGA